MKGNPLFTSDDVLNIMQYTEHSFLVWGKEATIANKQFLMDRDGKFGKYFKQATLKERGLKPSIPDDRKKNPDNQFKAWMFNMKKHQSLISDLIMADIEYVNWDEK